MTQFEITPEVVTVTRSLMGSYETEHLDMQIVSSPVRSLQWQSGLDYVLAATDTMVNTLGVVFHVTFHSVFDPSENCCPVNFFKRLLRFPIEECSSNVNCSSCVTNENPLCGWCVVENKCSRQSLCQNGKSSQ